MDSRPMTCREVVEVVTDYLDNALPPGRRAVVTAHLDRCPGCLEYVRQIQSTVERLRRR